MGLIFLGPSGDVIRINEFYLSQTLVLENFCTFWCVFPYLIYTVKFGLELNEFRAGKTSKCARP